MKHLEALKVFDEEQFTGAVNDRAPVNASAARHQQQQLQSLPPPLPTPIRHVADAAHDVKDKIVHCFGWLAVKRSLVLLVF